LRFEIAWRALELAAILGREAEVADLVVQQYLDREPPPFGGDDHSVTVHLPGVCILASKAVSARCFSRLDDLLRKFPGALLDTRHFVEGAKRYAKGDWAGAAKKWRVLVVPPHAGLTRS
jgi:hypothetical protein